MKKYFGPVYLLLGLACFGIGAAAQQVKTIKKVPPSPTTAISGKVLYGQYCAVCHGTDGKGAGPAADALKNHPTDLTQISRQNKGRFPEDRFLKIVEGEETLVSHGTADMPTWGPAFRNMSTSQGLALDRIYSLLNYIEGLQAK